MKFKVFISTNPDAQSILWCCIYQVQINHQPYIQQSFAFFSDDLNHDSSFAFATQKQLGCYFKTNYSFIQAVEYFSDGCAGQYKNFKTLLNLTDHSTDFGLSANWNFFATSHGKSACDRIGGAIKRKLVHRSLAQPYQNQILAEKNA